MSSAPPIVPLRSRRRTPDSRPTVGLRVSHLLNTVDFRPPGFSSSATLIVRRFRDPLPKRLEADPWAVKSTAAWESSAQSQLEDLARRAARPAGGFVPLNSSAVLFADEGELLACLAHDLLSGTAPLTWWWRAILRTLPPSGVQALVAAWSRDARYVPSALSHLVSRGEAVSVLAALSPAQAWTIFQEVARSFDVQHLCSAFSSPGEFDPSSEDSHRNRTSAPQPFVRSEMQRKPRRPIHTPWQQLHLDAIIPPALGPERSVLLGLGLGLQQAPSVVRGYGFAWSLAHWRQSATLKQPTVEQAYPEPKPARNEPSLAGQEASSQFVPAQNAHRLEPKHHFITTEQPLPHLSTTAEPVPTCQPLGHLNSSLDWPILRTAFEPSPDSSSTVTPARLEVEFSGTPDIRNSVIATPPSLLSKNPASAAPERDAPPTATAAELAIPSAAIHKSSDIESLGTELGGVLFLINLLTALDLPRTIEKECNSELGVSAWEMVELLGRTLLSSAQNHLASDALWNVLAALDGREAGTQPGKHFKPAPFYRAPHQWIASASSTDTLPSLQVRVRYSHWELWHPDGFPVLMRRSAQRPSRVAIAQEIEHLLGTSPPVAPFRRARPRLLGCHPLGMTIRRPLRQFLSFVLPYVRLRLGQSLGIVEESPSSLVNYLLLQPAKLSVTRTHVDLLLRLSQAKGRIRLSGLDANPGWVPRLGRVVTFHFGM